MGKLISVWSPNKKTGKTIFIYNLIKQLTSISIKDISILVCCVNLSYGNLLDLFNIDENEINLEDIVNFKLHPDNDLNLKKALAKINNVHFIGAKKTTRNQELKYMNIFENLIQEFKQVFDLVIFDTISGNQSALTNLINRRCDCIINVICQDIEILDKYPFVNDKTIAYVVNHYADIYPDIKELSERYKIKPVIELPHCNELMEMKNKGKIDYYWQHDSEYNRALNKITRFMAGRLEIDCTEEEEKQLGSDRKGILSRVRGVFNAKA